VSDGIGETSNLSTRRFYHGTRAARRPGDLIGPSDSQVAGGAGKTITCVYLTSDLDEAIWDAELEAGEGPGRVYVVEPIGPVEGAVALTARTPPGHPSMSRCSREPLRVTGEVTEWPL
jgi:rifampin ADP-ribosylating transferase